MVRKKDVEQIKDKLDSITGAALQKAIAYDTEQQYLKDIVVNVDRAIPLFDEKTFRYVVKITYKVEPTILYVDDDGEATLNNRFRAMNELNLIPLNDLQTISNAISRANTLNGGDNH